MKVEFKGSPFGGGEGSYEESQYEVFIDSEYVTTPELVYADDEKNVLIFKGDDGSVTRTFGEVMIGDRKEVDKGGPEPDDDTPDDGEKVDGGKPENGRRKKKRKNKKSGDE